MITQHEYNNRLLVFVSMLFLVLFLTNTKQILDISGLGLIIDKTQTTLQSLLDLRSFKEDIIPEPVTIVLPAPKIDYEELHCLAENIYFEARNQSFAGQLAVAMVTVNRTKNRDYPKSICAVVKQRDGAGNCQFSWTCVKQSPIAELGKWKQSYDIAHMVLVNNKDLIDITQGATHFHANYIKPPWANWSKMRRMTLIDNHIFYKKLD